MKTILLSVSLMLIISFRAVSQNVGDTAPDFSLADLSGNTVKLSDYKGKVVALFFFGYACPSCIAVAPEVKSKIQDVFGSGNNFVLLGLDQWDGNKSGVESYKTKTGATYPLLQKASGTAALFSSTYDRIIIIDTEGKIAFKGTKLVTSDLDAAVSVIRSLLLSTALSPLDEGFNVNVYPNPMVSALNVDITGNQTGTVSVSLINIQGNRISLLTSPESSDGRKSFSFDMGHISPGIYYAIVEVGSNKQVIRVMKN